MMTAKEIESGCSETVYPLLGMYAWSLYEARDLPRWARPYNDLQFSAENLPSWHDMNKELRPYRALKT